MNGRKRLLDIIIIRLVQKLLKTCQIDYRLLLNVKLRFELYSILKCAHCNAEPGLEKKKINQVHFFLCLIVRLPTSLVPSATLAPRLLW